MRVVLQIKSADVKKVEEKVFDRLPLLFGRSRICDYTISDPLLSRQHCSIEYRDERSVKLTDLGSANGTFVAGQRITEKFLDIGQSFNLGGSEVKVVSVEAEVEESTVEELIVEKSASIQGATQLKGSQAGLEEKVPAKTKLPSKKSESKSHLAEGRDVEVTLKTPTMFKKAPPPPTYQSRDWVQVSLLWKGELVDIQCFDRGEIVTLGSGPSNHLIVSVPSLPDRFQFLKILQNGVELHLHPSMKGIVETRGASKSLDDLRLTARQTEIGLSTFIQFSDRCLIEIGPFAVYIQSVRLNLTAPLTAPLVKEPLYTTILTGVVAMSVLFFMFLGTIQPVTPEEEKKPEDTPVVKLEPMTQTPPPPPPPPPPPKKKEEVKVGVKAQHKAQSSGTQGEGAKAKGDEGKTGRSTGTVQAKARPLGLETGKPKIRQAPKGAFGDVKDPNLAKKGVRGDQGIGSGKPKPQGTGTQAPSKDLKPNVKVEEEGVLGALGKSGGGGKAGSGGVLEGQGLGGELEGSVEGLERGTDLDVKGAGGRGAKGLGLGGGGSSLEVGGLKTKGKGGGESGFGLGSSGKKGEAEVSYVAEEVEVRDGLTREEIERVVRAHQNEIQTCYEKALIQSGNTGLGGRLKVKWFVNTNGNTENIEEVNGVSDGGYLFNCVSQRVKTWQFPKPRGGHGAGVSWPWVFRKGG